MDVNEDRSASVVQGNLISRRSVYRFTNDSVERSRLEAAFEAARHAPCHKHTHPWRFYVLGQQTRLALVSEVERLTLEKDPNAGPHVVEKARNKVLSPPVLIAVASLLSQGDSFREEEDYAATVCALHNLVLSLWDQGIGAQWTTGAITRSPVVYGALGIPGEEQRVIGFIKAGYPAEVPKIKKRPLAEIRTYLP